MNKRHGIDEYGIFLVWLAVAISILSFFLNNDFVKGLALVVFVYGLFRALSRNSYKRTYENRIFKEKLLNPIKKTLRLSKKNKKDKNYKYITCPNCKQDLRIPKDKGKIKVKCPKCGNKFDARS
ncbi:MAG: hypothetical protein Q4D88_03800 [Anaerococcus sp.]|nr:hypothetical protein [Anaerococcus sp.]